MIIPQKLLGDCRETLKTLPEKSFQLCITSPPYWGLRSYLPKGHPLKSLEIGCEPTLELYLEHLVDVFAQVHRVLRDDGTLVVNMGDAYASTGGHADTACNDRRGQYNIGNRPEHDQRDFRVRGAAANLKPKDLLMLPARVAMSLQADGWYLRSMIPWIKPSCMPESCMDRPTNAIEYLFLFSKSEGYYYDKFAAMNPVSGGAHRKNSRMNHDRDVQHQTRAVKQNRSFSEAVVGLVAKRNRRNSDWFMESLLTDDNADPAAIICNAKGTKIQHFASYPHKLIEPFIKLCTSEAGCCGECGAPWVREVGMAGVVKFKNGNGDDHKSVSIGHGTGYNSMLKGGGHIQQYKTTGWAPGCDCQTDQRKPCSVLDPFGGTSTTAEVCVALGRDSAMCELNPEYFEAARQRDSQTGLALL